VVEDGNEREDDPGGDGEGEGGGVGGVCVADALNEMYPVPEEGAENEERFHHFEEVGDVLEEEGLSGEEEDGEGDGEDPKHLD
jgi:hypothetical protein